MKLTHLVTATAAVALLGGAAYAQTKNDVPKGPTPGSVTGDWNGAHAPSDDKQYQEKVVVPLGATPPASTDVAPPADTSSVTTSDASAATAATASADASVTTPPATMTTTMVTNGPVPDTAENRAKYGQPLSRAGKRTAARGN